MKYTFDDVLKVCQSIETLEKNGTLNLGYIARLKEMLNIILNELYPSK